MYDSQNFHKSQSRKPIEIWSLAQPLLHEKKARAYKGSPWSPKLSTTTPVECPHLLSGHNLFYVDQSWAGLLHLRQQRVRLRGGNGSSRTPWVWVRSRRKWCALALLISLLHAPRGVFVHQAGRHLFEPNAARRR